MEVVVVLLLIILALAGSGSRKNRGRNTKAPTAARKGGSALETSKLAQNAPESIRNAIREAEAALASPAQKQAEQEAEAALAQIRERARRRVKAAKLQAQQQPGLPGRAAPAQPTVSAPQGMSAGDDEGCVGGSMPHDHAEGESRTEHAAHIAAMEARDRTDAAAHRGSPRAVDAAQMRRAVVMAEILDRPVSLRRRRAG